MSRREFLQLCALGTAACFASPGYTKKSSAVKVQLTTRKTAVNIVGPDFPATDVWSFNGQVPGTEIRLPLGRTLDIRLRNELTVPTSVHWHGVRLPNAMDGVAGLTQDAIQPGDTFHYQFAPPDAGTYWYHSHVNAYEQVGRGLYGPLIIEERDPPKVDRDLTWMIDDWRLLKDASISDDFGAGHDMSHAGRIGNVPTVNGRFRDVVKVRTGERIRLRLINASNARNFSLSFGALTPTVIAIDGQPITPYQTDEPITIGVAGRVDLILDMTEDPGARVAVMDQFYRDSFQLTSLLFEPGVLRSNTLDEPVALSASTLPTPELDTAELTDVIIGGGAMGGLQRAQFNGEWLSLREVAQRGYVWAINDVIGNSLDLPPLIDVKKGTSVKIRLRNDTAFPHPMHLHGHHMQLVRIDDQVLKEPYWVDSPLLMPRQTMELAFVADNPGNWLFHCHALEHHAAGLGALMRVSV